MYILGANQNKVLRFIQFFDLYDLSCYIKPAQKSELPNSTWHEFYTSSKVKAIHRSSLITKKSGFQLPHLPTLHRPLFPALFRDKRAYADMGMPRGELYFLRLVGLALSLPDRVFYRDGRLVRDVAILS